MNTTISTKNIVEQQVMRPTKDVVRDLCTAQKPLYALYDSLPAADSYEPSDLVKKVETADFAITQPIPFVILATSENARQFAQDVQNLVHDTFNPNGTNKILFPKNSGMQCVLDVLA